MANFEYKTLVPAIVGAGVLLYTAVTGHVISSSVQNIITTDVVAVVSFGLSVWGIFKSHAKKPTDITPKG